MLEKHITLARVDGGPDAGFSLEPEEFKDFVQQSRAAFRALGKVDYSNTDSNN
ncbi:MAG: pseudaminic acid synthase, partial [Flavobacteriales bacterium]|nr:pseudaminic acid synthase [Flavobacteriales bacterium]